MAVGSNPEAIQARAERIRTTLEESGTQIDPDEAMRLASSDRATLNREMSRYRSEADPESQQRVYDEMQDRLDQIDRTSVKKESFLKSTVMFPIRHPLLTIGGVLAAAYFGAPLFAKGWAAAESALASVPMNRIIDTIRSARFLTGRIGAAPGFEVPPAVGA